MMRQSALKKKRSESHKGRAQSPERTTSANGSSDLCFVNRLPVNRNAGQAGQASNQIDISKNAKSIAMCVDSASEDCKQPSSSDTGRREADPKSPMTKVHLTEVRDIGSGASTSHRNPEPAKVFRNIPSPVTLDDDRVNNSLKEHPLEKSFNIKRMISAFEGGVAQDMSPFTNTPPSNLQSGKIGKEGYLKDKVYQKSNPDNSGKAESISARDINPLSEMKLPTALKFMRRQGNISDLPRDIDEDKQLDIQQSESSMKRFQEKVAHLDSAFEVSYKGRHAELGNNTTNMIFSEAGRSFCVTTGGKRVMDLMNSCNIEAKSSQGDLNENNIRSDGSDDENGDKTIHEARRSSSGILEEDDGTPEGPMKQVVKIAIMIGFGTLVLLTRQRQSR